MSKDDQDPMIRPKRKLSRFLAKEMIYDYLSDQLDHDRKAAFDDLLSQDYETQRDLESIKDGLKYCEQLAQTKISEPLMQEIRDHKGFWGKLWAGRLWSDWPDSIKWGIEAVGISAIAGLVAVVIPWKKIGEILPKPSSQIVLVEVQKEEKLKDEGAAKVAGLSDLGEGQVSSPVAFDAPKVSPKMVLPKDMAPGAGTVSQGETSNVAPPQVKVAKTDEAPKPVKTVEPIKSGEDEEVDAPGTVGVDGEEAQTTQDRKPLKGFVYRAFMGLDELDRDTPLMVAEVKKMDGKKAGQVELGWRKPKGSYFHFSLPESNYDELLKYLRNFGPVRIYKDPHWRVMPEGQIRFILWVEDNKVKK